MIPKLYESNETEFKTNGLGSLSDAISCKVTEERNGAFELEMEYPVGGLHYDLIESNRIIYAKPNETSDPQPFDIKEVTLSMDGMKATIYAQHMRYRLNGVPVKPFSATGITNALQGLVDNSLIKMGFTVWTDINNSSSKFELKEPNTFGQLLGGTDGSILDVFSGSSGCEYEFDKKAIKLWAHRGADNGVTIRYGKNLKGCKMETNIESVYTGVLAYWTKEDDGTTTSIQGDIQYIDNHDKYPREQIYLLDCSSDYTEQPSTSELNAKAKAYGTNNNIGEPSVSADVEFYQLWQTEEYKNVAPLERVSLCDTVHVIFRELGCNVSAIVNKTVYDTLLERYDSISIGSAKSKLGDTVKQTAHDEAKEIKKDTVSVVQNSIDNAVNKIRGGTDGHVVLATNANGETNELYAYDGESLSSASKVLRLNYEGIAGSSNGVNGKYSLAISTDGTINANQITTGTIKAIGIEGSSISGGTITGTTITFGTDKTLTMSGDADGSILEGDGWFKVSAVGGFQLINYKDSSKTQYKNLIRTASTDTLQEIQINNYHKDGTNNMKANEFWERNSDTDAFIGLNNFDPDSPNSSVVDNFIYLRSYKSSSNGGQKAIYIQNQKNGVIRNWIALNSQTSTDSNNYLNIVNAKSDGSTANRLYMQSDTNSDARSITLENKQDGTYTANYLRMIYSSSLRRIGMYQYDASHNQIGNINITNNEAQIGSGDSCYLHFNTDGYIYAKTGNKGAYKISFIIINGKYVLGVE